MKHALILSGLVTLAGCGAVDSARRWVEPAADLRVQEVARTQQCGSFGEDSRVTLFRDLEALKAWEVGRVSLSEGRELADAPYVLVEMGQRWSQGYGIAVSRAARLRSDGLLTLNATFIEVSPGTYATPTTVAPCVLLKLPKNEYRVAEVRDQSGRVRVSSEDAATPEALVTEPERPIPAPVAPEAESSWWPF